MFAIYVYVFMNKNVNFHSLDKNVLVQPNRHTFNSLFSVGLLFNALYLVKKNLGLFTIPSKEPSFYLTTILTQIANSIAFIETRFNYRTFKYYDGWSYTIKKRIYEPLFPKLVY